MTFSKSISTNFSRLRSRFLISQVHFFKIRLFFYFRVQNFLTFGGAFLNQLFYSIKIKIRRLFKINTHFLFLPRPIFIFSSSSFIFPRALLPKSTPNPLKKSQAHDHTFHSIAHPSLYIKNQDQDNPFTQSSSSPDNAFFKIKTLTLSLTLLTL